MLPSSGTVTVCRNNNNDSKHSLNIFPLDRLYRQFSKHRLQRPYMYSCQKLQLHFMYNAMYFNFR
jgi:hypothetical protein